MGRRTTGTGVDSGQARRRSVLHPTDFSTPARAAERVASGLATRSGRRLVLLHVLAPMPLFGGEGIKTTELLRFLLAQRRSAEAALAERTAALRDRGVGAAWILRTGTGCREIVTRARRTRASLIVIGMGRRGLSRIFLDSTAERVIACAPCPVLTVFVGTSEAVRPSRPRRRVTRAAAA
jgi:nucleotide-binding universal stress UspA family protein